ncbi:hypothetical protein B0H63DRAFT_297484 [Podospora didyma]|uniref:Diphthamide biosynthesis protein 4 n=1 Tax=Podospora didyma TaxID=330526 RepID=A0AAE0KAJ7_9PEZI|nr:hypothetical protein B0H63DRAFT_297484 [Podospora didyma]
MSNLASPPSSATYYDILGLSLSAIAAVAEEDDPKPIIKRGYRRALLHHHPDKNNNKSSSLSNLPKHSSHNNNSSSSSSTATTTFTVDQISSAYAVLSSSKLRAEYDAALRLSASSSILPSVEALSTRFQTGIENVDLDDLECDEYSSQDEKGGRWYRSCRCGNPRGYQFGEADLEEVADLGELMVGCADCSLWMRVHFAVVHDDSDEARSGDHIGGSTATEMK